MITQTTINWMATISGAFFMAHIVAVAYRFALSPGVTGPRRTWLLRGVAFLTVSLLLAAVGTFYSGPVRIGTSPMALGLAALIGFIGYTIFCAWISPIRPTLINRK